MPAKAGIQYPMSLRKHSESEDWIARLREGFAELSIDDSLGEQIR